jgi:RNA polymerase sigma factor (sigma-70 family)
MNNTKNQKPNGARIFDAEFPSAFTEIRQGVGDATDWPDSRLIAGVRRDPVDAQALDALIGRHWKPLFAQCQMLTVDPDQASDLAQAAWRHILQARQALQPDGDFRDYLFLTATNLWRERTQSAHVAKGVAAPRDGRPAAPRFVDNGEEVAFTGAAVADLKSLTEAEQMRLQQEIDAALGQLTPLDRDVLLARYLTGKSSAEIGRRSNRKKQSARGGSRMQSRL